MSEQDPAHSQDLMLKSSLNKMGIENVPVELDKLKARKLSGSEISLSFKKRKTSEGEDDSDFESAIIICIDFCDTDNPRLREIQEINDIADELLNDEKEDDLKGKSEEYSDPFQIPEPSSNASKSRTNSEKSLDQKKLTMNKLASNVSIATQSTPMLKTLASKKNEKVKDAKSFDFTNSSVQNNENEFNFNMKDIELSDSKIHQPEQNPVDQEANEDINVMLEEVPALELEASEHLDDVFQEDFKDDNDYNVNHIPYAEPDDAKLNFNFGDNYLINEPHPAANNEPLNNFGNLSIDDFGHKEPSYNMNTEFFIDGLMNDHHNDFHFESDLP